MAIPRHPLRPLLSALRAVAVQAHRIEIWLPFLGIAAFKLLLLVASARLDLIPGIVLWPVLRIAPDLEQVLHYPQLLFRLPQLAQALDLVCFLSLGALAQGWAISRLVRAWGSSVAPAGAAQRRARAGSLVLIAVFLVAVPWGVSHVLAWVGLRDWAPMAAIGAGAITAMLLFVAPAFVVVHGMPLGQAIAASIRQLGRLPIAVPLAVALVSLLHVPAILLRSPAIRAGAGNDPDWILAALLGQLPAEILGAALSAGLAAYFALRTSIKKSSPPRLAAAATAVALVWLCGCSPQAGDALRLRYECERWIERGRLRELALIERETSADSTAWLNVADLYDRALTRLGPQRLESPARGALEHDLGRLACKALLGRAEARLRAERIDQARRDYRLLIDARTPYRGAQGDAALGLARCEDRSGRWNAAHAAFQAWMEGVRAGRWPLHRNGLVAPAYVSRRLRDRGARAARVAWVDLAAAALDSAAARGQLEREARTSAFGLLVSAERWEEAYATLGRIRSSGSLRNGSGALLVAEASLLAGGLGRDREALGILAGLQAERSAFDGQHRVAGWLLLGEVQSRARQWSEAQHAYENAAAEARSESGRSEAMLGLARVHAGRGELSEARRLYTQLRDVYIATPAGLQAPLEELRLLYNRGLDAEARALTPVALAGYRRVIQQYGTELPALLAAQHSSECLGLAGSWDKGVVFLDSIATSFGDDPRAGMLLMRAARVAAEQLEDRQNAGRLLAELQARYPDSDVAVLARGFADSLALHASLP
jgi:hypothetical protein